MWGPPSPSASQSILTAFPFFPRFLSHVHSLWHKMQDTYICNLQHSSCKAESNCCEQPLKAPEEKQEATVNLVVIKKISIDTAVVAVLWLFNVIDRGFVQSLSNVCLPFPNAFYRLFTRWMQKINSKESCLVSHVKKFCNTWVMRSKWAIGFPLF